MQALQRSDPERRKFPIDGQISNRNWDGDHVTGGHGLWGSSLPDMIFGKPAQLKEIQPEQKINVQSGKQVLYVYCPGLPYLSREAEGFVKYSVKV